MEPIIAAALVAVGLIVAALVIQRRPSVAAANGHAALEERPAPATGAGATAETSERIAAAERRLAEAKRRTAELERRERELVERERDCVQRERDLERQQAEMERL